MNTLHILTWIVVSYYGVEKIDAGKYSILGIKNGFKNTNEYYNPQYRIIHKKCFTNKDSLEIFVKKIYDFKANGIIVSSDYIENVKYTELTLNK